MFEDVEDYINLKAAVIAILLSSIFIAMIWGVPIWDQYPLKNKIIITVVLPFASYLIVIWQMNR